MMESVQITPKNDIEIRHMKFPPRRPNAVVTSLLIIMMIFMLRSAYVAAYSWHILHNQETLEDLEKGLMPDDDEGGTDDN